MQFPLGYKKNSSMVILRNGTAYLLLKRNKEPFIGHYAPVGGKIEPHESPINAAIRETFEETGLVINQPKFCGMLVESSASQYNWTIFIYVADIEKVPPPPCPEGALEWIEHHDLLNVLIPETDGYVYTYILDNKPFMFDAQYDGDAQVLKMTEDFENILIFEK